MPTGFGTGHIDQRVEHPQISDLQLQGAAGDTTALLQLIEGHLRAVRDRYVEPQLWQPQQINIVASANVFTQRIDFSTIPHNSVLISVEAGTLNLFVGDYSGMSQGTNPHIQLSAGTTQQIFLPLLGRVYTCINPSTTVNLLACLTPIAL